MEGRAPLLPHGMAVTQDDSGLLHQWPKRDLGKLLETLRLASKTKKLSELAPMCGMTKGELHKLEGGHGRFQQAVVKVILVKVEADAGSQKDAEGYLSIIHPRVPNKNATAVTAPSLVSAFAG